jgi:acyl-CoA synthetase (AMP-forming)/AMP-acid ligase II
MLLYTDAYAQGPIASGVWGRLTLDRMLALTAQSAPNRIAVVETASRFRLTTGVPERLTYGELDRRASALAAFFAAVNLRPDTVIGLAMPATADALVVLLGAWRAGLIVVPMPLAYGGADMKAAMEAVGARGIVTVATADGAPLGETARDVAVDLWQIRFVFGAGGALPDGLIDLNRVLEESDLLGPPPVVETVGNPADHVASIGLVGAGGVPTLVPRSHNQWMALGLMAMLDYGLDAHSVLATTLAPTGLAGIGLAIAPWLLSGSTLVLAQPTDLAALVDDLVLTKPSHVVAPLAIGARLAATLDRAGLESRLVLCEQDRCDLDTVVSRSRPVIDATIIGESAILMAYRPAGRAKAPLTMGSWSAPSTTTGGPVFAETRLKALPIGGSSGRDSVTQGELQVRGPTVATPGWPVRVPIDKARDGVEPFMATALMAQLVSTQPVAASLVGRLDDRASLGRLSVDLPALDATLRGAPGIADAGCFTVPDPVMGARIGAAIVVKPGQQVERADLERFAMAVRMSPALVPDWVVPLPMLPRDSEGTLARDQLAILLAPTAPS